MKKKLKPILTALRKIKGLGSFCADTTMPAAAISIKIDGIGSLKFPLTSGKIKKLIELATPAHFGWKDQTLLDKNVRNTWEIPGKLIKLDWTIPLEPVLDQLKNDLGLAKDIGLEANLHNLLIYEPGQFFKPHQDSEKVEDMIATLVVILPYTYLGGALVVGHHEEKIKITENHGDKLTLVSFYADCPHEIEMVKSGHRISLTFNLSVKKLSKKKISPCLNPQEELTQNLNEYFSKESCEAPPRYGLLKPNKFVYLLDHEYTQKGLSWDRLKNADHVRVEALREAAKSIGLDVHLVLAEVKEVWDCQMCDNPVRLKPNGKPSRKRTETYIICDDTTLIHWIDVNGKIIDTNNKSVVGNNFICWTKATNDFKPFESEYEKWMGNYGNTMDHWYHRAAIILWRKEDYYAIKFEMNPEDFLSFFLDDPYNNIPTETLRKAISSILPYWSSLKRIHHNKISKKSILGFIAHIRFFLQLPRAT